MSIYYLTPTRYKNLSKLKLPSSYKTCVTMVIISLLQQWLLFLMCLYLTLKQLKVEPTHTVCVNSLYQSV